MIRTTFDAAFWCIVSVVGIPPAVCLAIDEPAGMAIAAGCVVALFVLTSPGPASAPNGPRSRASRGKTGSNAPGASITRGVNLGGRVTRSCPNGGL